MEKYRVTEKDGSYIEYPKTELIPEGSTYEVIDMVTEIKIDVPEKLPRMNFIIQVFISTGKKYEDILSFIQNMPSNVLDEDSKYIVTTKLRGCIYFERHSNDLKLIAREMEITDKQLDDIFINGNLLEL